MKKPGRKGVSNVVPLPSSTSRIVLTPVGLPLTKQEREYFDFIVQHSNHLVLSDVPNVMLLACATVRALKARNKDDGQFEKELRIVLAASRALRLTPQASMQPVTAARHRRDAAPPSYYAVMDAELDAKDD